METKRIQEIFDSPVVRRIECIIIGTLSGYRFCYGKEYGEDNIRTLIMMRQCLLNSMFVLDDKNIELLTGFNESLKRQVIEARERCITLLDASTSSVHMDGEVRCDILIGANYPKDHPVQTTRAKKCGQFLLITLSVLIYIAKNISGIFTLIKRLFCQKKIYSIMKVWIYLKTGLMKLSLRLENISRQLNNSISSLGNYLYLISYGFATSK